MSSNPSTSTRPFSEASSTACCLLRSPWSALAALTAVSLAGLYVVLFVLLQLESFALLVGSAVLLLMLGLLMAATRKLAPDGTDGSSEAG